MKFYMIVAIFIFFVYGIIANMIDERDEYLNKFKLFWKSVPMGFLFGLSGFTIVVAFWFFGSVIASCVAEVTDVKYFEKPIYSLQDNMATEGRFAIGRGHVDTNLRYYFLANTKYGYKVEYVDSNSAYLQKDGKQKIEFYEKRFENDIVDYFFDYADVDKNFYVLHIPQDAIEMDYSIDLK